MMPIHLIFVGGFSAPYFEQAQKEYEKRIGAFSKVISHPVKEAPLSANASAGEIAAALEREGAQIMETLNKLHGCYRIAMYIEGEQMTSEALSRTLEELPHRGFSSVAFIIGSSYGLSDTVVKACDRLLSLSRMTLPHQLARVVLTEQLYRACTITAGKTYHK